MVRPYYCRCADKGISLSRTGNLHTAKIFAQNFLKKLPSYYNLIPTLDASIDLSRGDYKICDQKLREEVEPIGFRIEKMETFGPIDTIVGMAVYILGKA